MPTPSSSAVGGLVKQMNKKTDIKKVFLSGFTTVMSQAQNTFVKPVEKDEVRVPCLGWAAGWGVGRAAADLSVCGLATRSTLRRSVCSVRPLRSSCASSSARPSRWSRRGKVRCRTGTSDETRFNRSLGLGYGRQYRAGVVAGRLWRKRQVAGHVGQQPAACQRADAARRGPGEAQGHPAHPGPSTARTL